MSEYIGSRISLISKSDIKYVGILKAIDSETATVSLANVQCFGTEGRKGNPAEEIPGSSIVYDGIVFRGSDVKDINILAAPKEQAQEMPNDPAILGSAQPAHPQSTPSAHPQHQQHHQHQNPQHFPPPPPHAFQQHPNQFGGFQGPPPPGQFGPRFGAPAGPHGFPGSPGAVPGYGPPFGGPPPPGYNQGYGPPSGHGFHPPPPPGPFSPQQIPTGPSDQRQPPQGPAQSGPGKQGAPQPPAQPQQKTVEMSSTPEPSAATSAALAAAAAPPRPPVESKPAGAKGPAIPTQPAADAKPAARAAGNRVAVPLPRGPAQQPPVPEASKPQNTSTATEAATAAVAAAMAKLGVNNAQKSTSDVPAQSRPYDSQTRGRGRGRGAPRGDRGGLRGNAAPRTVEVPKEDYDFESANAKFNKQEMAKEAIASGSPITSPVPDTDDAEAAQPGVNGHSASTPADAEASDDVIIPSKPIAEKGYDKKSSFFDNISSDLRDRTEQAAGGETTFVDGRAMRSQERNKNMETFGQGSVDGGYRGRGRGRGRGFGGRGRGFAQGGRGGFEVRGTGYRGRGRSSVEAES